MMDIDGPVPGYEEFQNPMLIDPIVCTVLKFLPVTNLKSSRYICHKWSLLARTELKRKGKLDLKRKSHFEKISDWNFENKLFQCLSFESPLLLTCATVMKNCTGDHIKRIEYTIVDDEYNLKEFQSFLDKCPNIQEIELKFIITDNPIERLDFFHHLNQRTRSKVNCIDIICDFEVDSWLPDVLDSCPCLHTLKLQLDESSFKRLFKVFSDKSDTIGKIQHLQVGGLTYLFTVSSIEHFMNVLWQLTNLRISVQNNIPSNLLRMCLHGLRNTLTNLQLSWFCWNENDWGSSRESLIPLSLTKLKQLEVNTNDNNIRGFLSSESLNFIPTFVTAIQLPQISSLRLNGTSTLGSFQKYIRDNSGNDLLTGQSQSLQSLTLQGNFNDYSCFLQSSIPWLSNITELNLVIQSAQPELISSVFATMHQIQNLALYFKDCREFPWEILMTGQSELVSRRVSANGIGLKTTTQNKPLHSGNSIANLQALTSLRIQGCRISDSFIYNGLIHLNKLFYVYIPEAKFTKAAVAVLKEKMRPFACLNFSHKSEDICKFIHGF